MGEPRSLSGEFDTVVQLLLLVMTVMLPPGQQEMDSAAEAKSVQIKK